MDEPGLDPVEHARALRGLARLNRLSRAGGAIARDLIAWSDELGRGLRVLDIASGGGDVVRRVRAGTRRSRYAIEVDGCDVSETAVEIARSGEGSDRGAYFVVDALRGALPAGYDVMMCSLFMHHLHEEDAADLLGRMFAASAVGVIVSDLVRSGSGLAMAYGASRVFTRSRIVHEDAVRSVRAAFTVEEMGACAARAGIESAAVRRIWPERMLLTARRVGDG